MSRRIESVAVLGCGTMGSGIAADTVYAMMKPRLTFFARISFT